MAKLTDSGKRALGIVKSNPGVPTVSFALEFWGRVDGLNRIAQAETLLGALADEGLISGSMRFRRHGRLWTLTLKGREVLNDTAQA